MSENSTTRRRGLSTKQCTPHVSRNLQKSLPGLREPWQSCSLENVEDFSKQAQEWLRDNSELRSSTIENADYAELLEHFRMLAEWKPKAKKAAKAGVLARNTDGLSSGPEMMVVTVVNAGGGTMRIHAHGCKDIKKDKEETGVAWTIVAPDRDTIDREVWGDIASDRFPEGSPEWKQECAEDAAIASVYLPCVRFLEGKAPKAKRSRKTVSVKTVVPEVVTITVPERVADPEILAKLLDIAKTANTPAARASWSAIADKYQRGEMTNMRYL
jgi:hypothetical protein